VFQTRRIVESGATEGVLRASGFLPTPLRPENVQ
jgi:hypothetical protein